MSPVAKKVKRGGVVAYIGASFFDAKKHIEKEAKESRVHKIDSFSFNESEVLQLLASASLFERQTIVFSDMLSRDILLFLKNPVLESAHDIFFVESEDFKWKQDFVVSLGGEVRTMKTQKAPVAVKQKSYAFDLGTAILDKNKKAAWLAYHKALQNDEVPEAIHSAVWWTIKQLVPASPIPRFAKYKKSYDAVQISKLAVWWMHTLHSSRLDGLELELAIEKAILEL